MQTATELPGAATGRFRLWLLTFCLLLVSACDSFPIGGATAPTERRGSQVPRETAQQEAQRIKQQRELASRSGLVVLSAGARAVSGRLSVQVAPVTASGRKMWLTLPLNCRPDCLQRKMSVGGRSRTTSNALSVATLAPGRWRLIGIRYGRVSRALKAEKPFEVRKGYATYLGAFYPRILNQAATKVQFLRYSAMQQDMTRALSIYPQVRGRQLINTVSKLRKPAPL